MKKIFETFAVFAAHIGLVTEKTPDGVFMSEAEQEKLVAEMNTANQFANDTLAQLQTKEQELATANTSLQTATQERDEARTQLSAAQAQLTTANATIADLQSKLAARSTDKPDVSTTGTEGGGEPEKYSYTKNVLGITK